MGKHYSHLQTKKCITIYEMLYNGFSIQEIADELGFHKTTIYRELNRNSCHFGYRPDVQNNNTDIN